MGVGSCIQENEVGVNLQAAITFVIRQKTTCTPSDFSVAHVTWREMSNRSFHFFNAERGLLSWTQNSLGDRTKCLPWWKITLSHSWHNVLSRMSERQLDLDGYSGALVVRYNSAIACTLPEVGLIFYSYPNKPNTTSITHKNKTKQNKAKKLASLRQ